MIFQKILKLDYIYPDGFCASAKDLVEKLLVRLISLYDFPEHSKYYFSLGY